MSWAYSAYFGGRALVLVATAILARLLTPTDFGIIALALIFTTFMDAVRDLGLGEALIVADPEEEAARAQTVFGWMITFGFLLSAATAAASPLISSFFREPRLAGILAVIGCDFFLRSLGATHDALARKHLNYRVRTISEICEVTVRGVLGIALALAGCGAWSLAIGFIAGVAASSLSLWLMVDFRPRLRLTHAHLKELLKFGGVLTIVDVGATLTYNLDYIFVGRVLGAAALGLYTIGFRLPELVILNLANVASDVLFPAYSVVDRKRLAAAYLLALRYITMATVPVAVGLVVFARPLTLVVFGSQWKPSIGVMQVISIYTLIVVLTIPAGTIFKVTGRARLLLLFTVPGIAALAVVLILFADRGIVAVAWCTTAMQAIALPFELWLGSKELDVPMMASFRAVAPAAASAAGMFAAVFPISLVIASPLLELVVAGVVGAIVYLGLLVLISRDSLSRLVEMAMARSAPSG
jgi:O-antigen/teichoic acid export membrane protein